RMTVENLVNFARIDVIAAGDDQFLLAVDDEQIAFVIEVPDIARVDPAVANRLRCFFRTIAITLDHLRTADPDFTAFVCGHDSRSGIEMHDLDHRLRWWKADRKDLALSRYRIIRIGCTFRHADAFENRAAGGFLPVRQQVFRERRGTGAADLEAR